MNVHKSEQGFSAIEAILILVVVVAIAGLGAWVYHQRTSKSIVSNNNTGISTPSAPAGTSQSIDSLTQQDMTSEQNIDSKYSTSDQITAQSANSAASNLGGAYDETTF